MDWESSFSKIADQERNIIKQTRKTLLHYNGQTWAKKDSEFNVTMGSLDGAEVCETVGLYILHHLRENGVEAGLYWDDGLMAIKGTRRTNDNTKKLICSIFKSLELNITIDTNLIEVDFLDATFNLLKGEVRPFKKPNNQITYVHKASNHPTNVTKNIPEGVNKRLNSLQQ